MRTHTCTYILAHIHVHTVYIWAHIHVRTVYIWPHINVCTVYIWPHINVCTVYIWAHIHSVANSGQHSDIVRPFWYFVRPKKFGSDIWLSTTSCSFHTHSDDTKLVICTENVYTCAFNICSYTSTVTVVHVYFYKNMSEQI